MIILSDGTQHRIGKHFWPDIHVIAGALSHINRFTGHVGPYNVAQHCCLVSDRLPGELKLAGLLHDAPEAYIGDVSAPLKRHIKGYAELETFYHRIIDNYYGVETRHHMVKDADLGMLLTEARVLGLPEEAFRGVPSTAYDLDFEVWGPERSQNEFMLRFYALGGRV